MKKYMKCQATSFASRRSAALDSELLPNNEKERLATCLPRLCANEQERKKND